MLKHFYLSIALLLSMVAMIYISYISWKHRKYPTAFKIFFLMLAALIYTSGYAYEIILPDMNFIKGFLKVEYIGIPFIPVISFMLAMDLIGVKTFKKWYGLFFLVPVLTFIIQHTNDFHHLFYKDLYMEFQMRHMLVHLVKGPWYWVHITYSFLLVSLSLIILLKKYRQENTSYKKQILMIIFGLSIPFAFSIFYVIRSDKALLDLTPFGLAISGCIFTWLNYRYNLLQFTPIVFEKVFETLEEGVIIIDGFNHIVNFNQSAVNIIPELDGVLPIPMDNNSNLIFSEYSKINDILKQNKSKETELLIQKGKSSKVYKMKLSVLVERRKIIGKILFLTDITSSKMNRSTMTAATAQLNALKIMNNRILSIVEKEIQKPLDRLNRCTETLCDKSWDLDNTIILVEEIQNITKEITVKMNNITECFKLKYSDIPFSLKGWQLSILIQEAINEIINKAQEKEIAILSDIEDLLFVHTDKNLLNMVLVNLLTNAIKFTKRTGKVEITAYNENNSIIISVKDTGIGIDSEKVQVLFQDVESNPGKGTEGELGVGLGLFICRHLIKRISGDIWVDSTIGEGSNFFISVPNAV